MGLVCVREAVTFSFRLFSFSIGIIVICVVIECLCVIERIKTGTWLRRSHLFARKIKDLRIHLMCNMYFRVYLPNQRLRTAPKTQSYTKRLLLYVNAKHGESSGSTSLSCILPSGRFAITVSTVRDSTVK